MPILGSEQVKDEAQVDMTASRREKLAALGPERLADALIALEGQSQEAEDMVERLVATPGEIIKRFKAKLAGLKRAHRFISWRENSSFARELSGLLFDLEEGVEDGKIGVELVARFFEIDNAVFERCDDSNGNVGDVFRYDATRLFTYFAMDCADKKWLSKIIIKLLAGNENGTRDHLLGVADSYLSREDLMELTNQFWTLAEECAGSFEQSSWFGCVEELAAQLGDAPLFEKSRLAACGEPGTAACLDIAEIYLKNGEIQTALNWVERDPDPGSFQEDKRELLLQAIYTELGDSEKVSEIVWKRFHQYRSVDRLNKLLAVIGPENREAVVAEGMADILTDKIFRGRDVEFLLETGNIDAADKYLLQSADQFDGDSYFILLPLAQTMEKEERNLVASLLYRALLDSILGRGRSKAYSHGVRYLESLDSLAEALSGWQHFPSHETYKEGLRMAHGRKYSFWGKYDK